MDDRLKSKVNIPLVSLSLLLFIGAYGYIGTKALLLVIELLGDGVPFFKTPFFIPLLLYALMPYSVRHLLGLIPTWVIDREGIVISGLLKSQKYAWNEIAGIELGGKRPKKFLGIPFSEEILTIQLVDDTEIHLWLRYYRNTPDLRLILERAKYMLHDKRQFDALEFDLAKRPRVSRHVDDLDATEYNGNHLWTFNGLVIYGWLIFFAGLSLVKPEIYLESTFWRNVGGVLIWLGLPIVLGYQTHYFMMTDRFLIVRNTFWFWRKHVYPLETIREVVIERPYNWPISLRVVTDDFRDKLYPASSLKKHTWDALIARIEREGIKVRKEV